MEMHLRRPTPTRRREQNATFPTVVLHVLERVHEIRDTPETDEAAEAECPRTIYSHQINQLSSAQLSSASMFFFFAKVHKNGVLSWGCR